VIGQIAGDTSPDDRVDVSMAELQSGLPLETTLPTTAAQRVVCSSGWLGRPAADGVPQGEDPHVTAATADGCYPSRVEHVATDKDPAPCRTTQRDICERGHAGGPWPDDISNG
jgi:hypothetical protein